MTREWGEKKRLVAAAGGELDWTQPGHTAARVEFGLSGQNRAQAWRLAPLLPGCNSSSVREASSSSSPPPDTRRPQGKHQRKGDPIFVTVIIFIVLAICMWATGPHSR